MTIVSVKIGTNLNRTTVSAPSNKTIRQLLEENDINYVTTTVYLDGNTVEAGMMDKTLEDFGITSNCYIIAAQKSANA